jgi:hypothetical protein
MMMTFVRQALALVSLALFSAAVAASGSGGESTAQTTASRLYNAGKGVYESKFACSICPLHAKNLTPEEARDVIAGKPAVQLSDEERTALKAYLTSRFWL